MKSPKPLFLAALILPTLLILALATYAALRPNYEVHFTREAPSELSREKLGAALHYTTHWTSFHHAAVEVKVIDEKGEPLPDNLQYVEEGSMIRLTIEPKKRSWKRFQLVARVQRYVPQELVELRLQSDSSGKIPALFDPLTWRIELLEREDGKPGTLIRGTAVGETRSGRARFFGLISPKIVMHQIFYPDLMRLMHFDPEAPQEQTRHFELTPQ